MGVQDLMIRADDSFFKYYLVEFFDERRNGVSDHRSFIPKHIFIALQTGSLTAQLSDNSQKVNGLAGITLGTIVQSLSCIITGSILGLAFIWKVALVAIGTLTSFFNFLTSSSSISMYSTRGLIGLYSAGKFWFQSRAILHLRLCIKACRRFERSTEQKGSCRICAVGL